MAAREIVMVVYIIAFLTTLWAVWETWGHVGDWQKLGLAFSIIVSFSSVLIANWVSEDEETSQRLGSRIYNLEEEVERLKTKLEKKE